MAKFRGGILIQARTLLVLDKAFRNAAAPDADAQRELLSFLGCLVLVGKSDLMVEGTIGERDGDKLRSAIERLGLTDKVQWLAPGTGKIADASRQAIDVVRLAGSWNSLLGGTAAKDWRLAQEEPAEVAQWLRETDAIVKHLRSVTGKPAEALALADHLASRDYVHLRGNKMLSGLAILESLDEDGSKQLSSFVTSYEAAPEENRYGMLSGLINEFRPPLLMAFAGIEGGVFAFSGNFSSIVRYRQAVWQRALGQVLPQSVGANPSGAIDQIYIEALARVGLLALHLARPSKGRMDLLSQARKLSEAPDYGAILRWIVGRQADWQHPGSQSDTEIAEFLGDLAAQLKEKEFLASSGKKEKDLAVILPDTASAAGKSAVGEVAKEALTVAAGAGAGAAGGAIAGPVGAAIGAALGAGAVGLTKYLLNRIGEQGDYFAGIANLASPHLAAYNQKTIGDKIALIWGGSSS